MASIPHGIADTNAVPFEILYVNVDLGNNKKKKRTKISQKNFDYILDLLKQSEKTIKGRGSRLLRMGNKRHQGKTLVWERKKPTKIFLKKLATNVPAGTSITIIKTTITTLTTILC